MTFLDSSVVIDYLDGVDHVVDFVDEQPSLSTSTVCVYEVLEGELFSAGPTDLSGARDAFGRVVAYDLTEQVVVEAATMQDRLLDDGEPMAPRDVMIAATARSHGETLVTSDDDFRVERLEDMLDVTLL